MGKLPIPETVAGDISVENMMQDQASMGGLTHSTPIKPDSKYPHMDDGDVNPVEDVDTADEDEKATLPESEGYAEGEHT